ncbi:MAG: hypothetical protein KKA90_02810 [Nanoarchaeota archaeon]|nr:hypothetical protein [Nanoarchaeota archaeon]
MHISLRSNFRTQKLAIFIVSAIITVVIMTTPWFQESLLSLGDLGHIGAFIIGFFFSYGMTTIPAIAAFTILAKTMNPFLLALVGAFGAVLSDYLIFHIVRDDIVTMAKMKAWRIRIHPKWHLILHLRKLAPLLGGLILASPLPDEVAMAVFGVGHLKNKMWLAITFTAKFFAILVIALAAPFF